MRCGVAAWVRDVFDGTGGLYGYDANIVRSTARYRTVRYGCMVLCTVDLFG